MQHAWFGESGADRVNIRRLVVAAGVVGSLLAVLGAGAAGAAEHHATKGIVISAAKTKSFGTVLVSGGTLYTLKASATPCTAACLKIWPAVTLPKGVTKATAGPGVNGAKLGTIKRAGGALQVTYAGKALYWFSGDKAAGQVRGNVSDKWGKWSAVVTVKPATTGSGTGSNSGTGGVAF